MFNGLKKILKMSKGNGTQNELTTEELEEQRKKRNAERREKAILSGIEKTGLTRDEVVNQMKDARKRLGISYRDYDRNDFYNIPIEEQEKKYEEVLARKERRKQHKTKTDADAVEKIMKATGWEHDYAVAQIEEARKRTGCRYKEFLIYKFYELDKEEQEKVFLVEDSRKITTKYDVNKKFIHMLRDKEATNNYFSQCLRRPWCVNTKISLDEFTEKFAESKRIIYKPLSGNRGRGVKAFDVSRENAKEVYEQLITFPEGVVEQYVVQHPEMSDLSPTSVNTLRVVTISSNTQQVTSQGKQLDIPYAALRMGGGNSIVDNFHSGGMVAAVDLETGELVTDAADMEGHVFSEHPATGRKIKGFVIPFFVEALKLVTDACEQNKIEGYLGWDIAITEDGPVLIEVNALPGVVLISMPYVAEKKGMKYLMEKYL